MCMHTVHIMAMHVTYNVCWPLHYRLQAWWRWINTADHGISSDQRKPLLRALDKLAKAMTIAQFEKQMLRVKHSQVYVKNIGFQVYFRREWESCIAMWAACYRQVGACMSAIF
jgi:hypothetical protein